MQGQGVGALMRSVAVHWGLGFPWVVQAKDIPHLCFAQGTLSEL